MERTRKHRKNPHTIRNTLQQIPHEIIVVDDNSSDGTFQTARLLADVAVTKTREDQTKGLLYGMQIAKYPVIITIDADLENNPEHIPELLQQITRFNIIVASRTQLPRISEKIASKTLGKLLGVTDTPSTSFSANPTITIGLHTSTTNKCQANSISVLTVLPMAGT